MDLKLFWQLVCRESAGLVDSTIAGAVQQLAEAGGEDASVVSYMLDTYFADAKTRSHANRLGHIIMSCERLNDIYRWYDGKKKQVLMVSNKSHGGQNCSFVIKALLIFFVAGLSVEELRIAKATMAEVAA